MWPKIFSLGGKRKTRACCVVASLGSESLARNLCAERVCAGREVCTRPVLHLTGSSPRNARAGQEGGDGIQPPAGLGALPALSAAPASGSSAAPVAPSPVFRARLSLRCAAAAEVRCKGPASNAEETCLPNRGEWVSWRLRAHTSPDGSLSAFPPSVAGVHRPGPCPERLLGPSCAAGLLSCGGRRRRLSPGGRLQKSNGSG